MENYLQFDSVQVHIKNLGFCMKKIFIGRISITTGK